MQGGAYAAKAIVQKLQDKKEIPPFKYFDKGSLAVIGRWSAVADVFGFPTCLDCQLGWCGCSSI